MVTSAPSNGAGMCISAQDVEWGLILWQNAQGLAIQEEQVQCPLTGQKGISSASVECSSDCPTEAGPKTQ